MVFPFHLNLDNPVKLIEANHSRYQLDSTPLLLQSQYLKLKLYASNEVNCFITNFSLVAAAEELIQHLKNENDQLRTQIDDLRTEVASIRHAFLLHVKFSLCLV